MALARRLHLWTDAPRSSDFLKMQQTHHGRRGAAAGHAALEITSAPAWPWPPAEPPWAARGKGQGAGRAGHSTGVEVQVSVFLLKSDLGWGRGRYFSESKNCAPISTF